MLAKHNEQPMQQQQNNSLISGAPLFTTQSISPQISIYDKCEKSEYSDLRFFEDDETLKMHLSANKPLRFDWENKWLRGD